MHWILKQPRKIQALAAILVGLSGLGCNGHDDDSDHQVAPPAKPAATPPPPAQKPPPSPEPEGPPEVVEPDTDLVILAGGDVSLAREHGQDILRDPDYDPFAEVAPLLKTADVRFVNLESQLSDQNGVTQSPNNRLIFSGPPQGARVLARAGIDIVSLANNHAWDYGRKALLETIANLQEQEVLFAGASKKPHRMYKPTVIKRKGRSIAWFAVTHIWNQGEFLKHEGQHYVAWARFDKLRWELVRARRKHDIVIVSYHGGGEYLDLPMPYTRRFMKQIMSTGVDAIIGHHPHVPQGVQWFEGRPVFYSLGNLVFGAHKDKPWTGLSFFARLRFDESGLAAVEACPYEIRVDTPYLLDDKRSTYLEHKVAKHIEFTSVGVGGTHVGPAGEYGCMPLTPIAEDADG